MNRAILALLAIAILVAHVNAQTQEKPAVIKKMEELGTVYLTLKTPKANKKDAAKKDSKPDVIIGVDFRPMAGSDPKEIAALVKELATLPDLQTILLLGRDVNDDAAAAIPTSAKITSIQFYNTSVTDKGIASLTRFKGLNRFQYTGVGLTDAGMTELGKIKSLSFLSIIDAKITDRGVLALRNLPNLMRLTVENTEASEQAIERLRESLPNLIDGDRILR